MALPLQQVAKRRDRAVSGPVDSFPPCGKDEAHLGALSQGEKLPAEGAELQVPPAITCMDGLNELTRLTKLHEEIEADNTTGGPVTCAWIAAW